MGTKKEEEKQWIYYLAAFIVIPYVIYIIPCFIRGFFPNLCCLANSSINNQTKIPHKPKPSKPCIEKEEIETVVVERKTEVTKTKPCPDLDAKIEIQKETIHYPPKMPQDVAAQIDKIKQYNTQRLQTQKENIQNEINQIKSSLQSVKIPQFNEPSEEQHAQTPDFTQIGNDFEKTIQKHIIQGNEIPLILTSIYGGKFKQGTNKFDQILSGNIDQRYTHAIQQDSSNRWCAPVSNATFSFWTPYPILLQSLTVNFPDFDKHKDTAKSFMIQLLLGDDVNYQSESFKVINETVTIQIPTKQFNRLRIIASGSSSVCIGNVKAYSSNVLI